MVPGRTVSATVRRPPGVNEEADGRKEGLTPVAGTETRLLILGSLPGDRSLAASEYYAHPRNQFWDLMAEVIGTPLRPICYSDRLEILRQHGIGLWDVAASAVRPGSLDSAMRHVTVNPLADFIPSLPRLAAVAFNGRTSFIRGTRALPSVEGMTFIALPSSSPAHAVGFARKQSEWIKLQEFLAP